MLDRRALAIGFWLLFTMPGCENSATTPEPATPSPSTVSAPKVAIP